MFCKHFIILHSTHPSKYLDILSSPTAQIISLQNVYTDLSQRAFKQRRKVIKMMYNSLERKCFCGLFMALLLENINPWPALESTVVMGIDQLWVILKGQPPKALCLLVLKLEGEVYSLLNFCKISSTLVNQFYKIV